MEKSRLYFIDNVRVFLCSLVIIHHIAIAYGAEGLWYYLEPSKNLFSNLALTYLVAINQSFFMGLFFMISGFFLFKSLRKKSRKVLILDKFKRLILPVFSYVLIISPLLYFIVGRFSFSNLLNFRYQDFSCGPLWFLIALFLISFVSIIWKKLPIIKIKKLNFRTQIIFALILSLLSFIVRIYIPVGKALLILGFQLAHFVQYIALFYIGICFSKHHDFNFLNRKDYIKWRNLFLIFVLILFPLITVCSTILGFDNSYFMGGMNFLSLMYSFWEQLLGITTIYIVLYQFKNRYNFQNKFMKTCASASMQIYIYHPIFVVLFSILFSTIQIAPILKFVILIPICVFCSFWFGIVIYREKKIVNF
jgi:fucose 4-O-acetylase-like acetyltransferase